MKKKGNAKAFRGLSLWVFLILAAVLLSNHLGSKEKVEQIPYSEFRIKLETGRLQKVKVSEEEITGYYTDVKGDAVKFRTVTVDDPKLVEKLQEKGVIFEGDVSRNWFQMVLFNFGPILLFIFIWLIILQQMRSGGRQAMSFGKSRAKLYIKDKKKRLTFNDVAGLEETKEELQEIVEFLKNPRKFTRLGGEIPKGVLMFGAPGTGKTLLAKAIAGEAEVPFFSTSGSEFVEMFVGVGASRIRDLFEKGRKNAPCLLFIDELDAVGRSRFSGLGGGHDEREQTLNQMLVELDGFDSREGVILIGATNRPDVLDPALLRRGRFDRHISVPNPNKNERMEILQLHAKKVKLAGDVDFNVLARRTPGFVGSDLANIVNEAALLAARENAPAANMHHMEEAVDRVIAGPEKKSRIISEEEKRLIAYHESGHTLVALHLPKADPVHKVSILSRGPALGYTLQLPIEDKFLTSEDEILDKLTVLLGGRSAEEIVFGIKTTGGHDDLRRATDIAYRIVTEFGMSEVLGPMAFQRDRDKIFLGRELAQGREYSEKTAQLIDDGVKKIVENCHARARKILEEHRDQLNKLAETLVEREVIIGDDIKKVVGMDTEVRAPEEEDRPAGRKTSRKHKDEQGEDKKSS
ncbi:MAG: ATP-dependent zinc metalloprotease FtsH [Elusimicrobia bacterium]|nr:ATP-dependent zinc metalloprotease FtsH [Elusimicrobiota bacterium]